MNGISPGRAAYEAWIAARVARLGVADVNSDELSQSSRPDPVPGELTAAERDLIRADLGQLLETLGLGDYARPQSPHEVFLECLAAVDRIAAFVRSLPCRCGLGVSVGEDEPCGRCKALGQRCGKDEPR